MDHKIISVKLLLSHFCNLQKTFDTDTGACSLTIHTDLLMASMLPEGLMSHSLSGEAASAVSWWAVSIGSGLGLLSSEVSGKIIGMVWDLARGSPAQWLGWGMTWVIPSLFPFFTYFVERKIERYKQQVSLVTGNMRQHERYVIHKCEHFGTIKRHVQSNTLELSALSQVTIKHLKISWGEVWSNKRPTKGEGRKG